MDIKKMKELNEKIAEKAMSKVEKSLYTDNWDCECYETLNYAIDNIMDLMKMEKHIIEEDVIKERKIIATDIALDDTEFMKEVHNMMQRKGEIEGTKALMMIVSELMHDLSIINTRLYEQAMRKIKEAK